MNDPSVQIEDRLRRVERGGHTIIVADFSDISTHDAGRLLMVFVDQLRQMPENSARVLFDTRGSKYDPSQTMQWKSYSGVFMTHLRRSAALSNNPLIRATVNTFRNLLEILGYERIHEQGRMFEDADKALDWLAE